MDVLILSRMQFAVATYFHFLFVPLTLGLSLLVAIMQTKWYRSGDEDYLRMTKFWGKLFLINFAIGVVTGITLEFQFGTNWSPVLGIRGRHLRLAAGHRGHSGVLPGIHVHRRLVLRVEPAFAEDAPGRRSGCVAIASNLSAFWILVANAWMQQPGRIHDPERPRGADGLLRGDHPALRDARDRAHAGGRLHPGRLLRAGDLRLAPPAPQPGGEFFRKSFAWRRCGRWSSPCSRWRRGT